MRFINKTNKNEGFGEEIGSKDSKLFKEKSVFTLTLMTPAKVF